MMVLGVASGDAVQKREKNNMVQKENIFKRKGIMIIITVNPIFNIELV